MEELQLIQNSQELPAIDIWGMNRDLMVRLFKDSYSSISLFGDSGVGKSSFIEQFAGYCASPNNIVGMSFRLYSLDYDGFYRTLSGKPDFDERFSAIEAFLLDERNMSNSVLVIDDFHTVLDSDFSLFMCMRLSGLIRSGVKCFFICPNSHKASFMEEMPVAQYMHIIDLEPATKEQVSKIGLEVYLSEYMASIKGSLPELVYNAVKNDTSKNEPLRSVDFVVYMKSLLSETNFNENKKIRSYFKSRAKNSELLVKYLEGNDYENGIKVKRKINTIDISIQKVLMMHPSMVSIDKDFVANTATMYYAWTKKRGELSTILKEVETGLPARIKGQSEACETIISNMKVNSVFKKKDGRPLGVYLFLGSSGVGKTETAKAIADLVFGGKMVRIDMSEYSEKISATRLIGSAPGYIGYSEGGQLTEQIKKNPSCVLLIDELEKGHPDIYNMFLSIFDEGYIKSASGEKVSFSDCLIIMTSNLGVHSAVLEGERSLGFGKADGGRDSDFKGHIEKTLKKVLRPEFINRIDKTIIFNRLSDQDIEEIAKIELDRLCNEVALSGNTLKVPDSISKKLATMFSKEAKTYGARPLKRYVDSQLKAIIADEIVKGNTQIELIDNQKIEANGTA